MSNNIEWAHTSVGAALVDPIQLQQLSPDGNEDGDWGLHAGDAMVYGSLKELDEWLTDARDRVRTALQQQKGQTREFSTHHAIPVPKGTR